MGADIVSSAISGGLGVAGAIYGGIKAGQERKRMDNYLSKMEGENEALYNKDYYGDYTNRTDTQALLKKMRDNLKRENQITTQTAAVTGATPEAINAQKQQNNEVVTNTVSNIAAQGQQWKDRVQNRYLNMKSNYSNMRYGNMADTAASYDNLMSNGIGTVAGAARGLSNNLLTTEPVKQPTAPLTTV